MCKFFPNSLKTQELNHEPQSQRRSGGVQNLPPVAHGWHVHTGRCWKRKRGANQLALGQQKGTTHSFRISVGLDHLTPFNQGGGAACTSTWQLRPQPEASSEET